MMKWVHFQCHNHTYTSFMQKPIRKRTYFETCACQTIKNERKVGIVQEGEVRRGAEKYQATHRNMNTQKKRNEKAQRPNDEYFIWWIMYLSQFVSWFDRTHHSNCTYVRTFTRVRDKIAASTCCCCCCFLFAAHTCKNKSSGACKHIWAVALLSLFLVSY